MAIREAILTVLKGIKSALFEEEENQALLIDFEKAKRRIMARNKRRLMQRLIPYVITCKLKSDNYLITEQEARELAEIYFLESKRAGNIDELNNIIEN